MRKPPQGGVARGDSRKAVGGVSGRCRFDVVSWREVADRLEV